MLYSTKDQWLSLLAAEGPPRDVALVTRYGPVDAERRALLGSVAASFAAPIAFAGDLDPLDLAAFATLALGPDPIPMRYLGIDDAWLSLCEVDLATRGRPLERVCIRLSGDERTGLDRLAHLPIDWPAHGRPPLLGPPPVGPEARAGRREQPGHVLERVPERADPTPLRLGE